MPLTTPERALAGVGISVASGCRPCAEQHLEAARQAGASDQMIMHIVNSALRMRRRATDTMGAFTRARLAVGNHHSCGHYVDRRSRLTQLVLVGAAYAVNCPSQLREELAAASRDEISADDVNEVLGLAASIKRRADRQMGRVAGPLSRPTRREPRRALAACG